MSPTQQKIIDCLRAGHKLFWFGDAGPEMSGFPFWPQKRTVRAMLKAGLLKWGEPLNETQAKCGICPIMEAAS